MRAQPTNAKSAVLPSFIGVGRPCDHLFCAKHSRLPCSHNCCCGTVDTLRVLLCGLVIQVWRSGPFPRPRSLRTRGKKFDRCEQQLGLRFPSQKASQGSVWTQSEEFEHFQVPTPCLPPGKPLWPPQHAYLGGGIFGRHGSLSTVFAPSRYFLVCVSCVGMPMQRVMQCPSPRRAHRLWQPPTLLKAMQDFMITMAASPRSRASSWGHVVRLS